MLPDAPGLFSIMTGWPRALDNGSANVRAAMSGVEPPGKPTKILTGLVGQSANGAGFFLIFWAVTPKERAQAAINTVADASRRLGKRSRDKLGFITVSIKSRFLNNHYLNSFAGSISPHMHFSPAKFLLAIVESFKMICMLIYIDMRANPKSTQPWMRGGNRADRAPQLNPDGRLGKPLKPQLDD